MILLEPKGYQPVSGAPVIFLAGPIHGAPPWQPRAFDLIREIDSDVVVATPRRFHSPEHYRWKAGATLGQFHRQRAWERYYMDLAALQGVIMFWLPGSAGGLDGMVYGATTRYEIGLWSSRFSRDPSIGLVVGTDGNFPTVHTIEYDLEYEMAGRTVYRTLEDTVAASIAIARCNCSRWVSDGCPEVALESELLVITHDELSQTCFFNNLLNNPMNDPDKLRSDALEMLRQQIGPKIEVRNKAEELSHGAIPNTDTTPEDFAELEEVPETGSGNGSGVSGQGILTERNNQAVEKIHAEMQRSGAWFLNGKQIPGPKYLAIGRSTYYIPFFQRLAVELRTPVYQSDYMEWHDPGHPEVSLAFYLRTAERIDINLEGINTADLREATTGAGRRVNNRHEISRPFMTSWEINQIYYTDFNIPVFWHTGGAMSHAEAFEVLGERVPKERIIED